MKLRQIGSNQTEVVINNTINKAFTDFATDYTVLFSYQTPVACHVAGVGFFKTTKKWSTTTSRHINKWLFENGIQPLDKTHAGVIALPQEAFDNLCSEVK